jgi:hypothetical protein
MRPLEAVVTAELAVFGGESRPRRPYRAIAEVIGGESDRLEPTM